MKYDEYVTEKVVYMFNTDILTSEVGNLVRLQHGIDKDVTIGFIDINSNSREIYLKNTLHTSYCSYKAIDISPDTCLLVINEDSYGDLYRLYPYNEWVEKVVIHNFNSDVLHNNDLVFFKYQNLQVIVHIYEVHDTKLIIGFDKNGSEILDKMLKGKLFNTPELNKYELNLHCLNEDIEISRLAIDNSEDSCAIVDTDISFTFVQAIDYLLQGYRIKSVTWDNDEYLVYDKERKVVYDETGHFVNIWDCDKLNQWTINKDSKED